MLPQAIDARREDAGDTLHGTFVPDPYRWLEDGNASEVKAWVLAHNRRTEAWLSRIPEREALRARLSELFEIGSVSLPTITHFRDGFRYFYRRRAASEEHPKLYVRTGLNGPEALIFDPDAERSGDSPLSLDWYYPSANGRYVAYGVSRDGSEDSTLRIRDLDSGRDLAESITKTRHASVAWEPDSAGFYYTRYPSPGSVPAAQEWYRRRVFRHQLGTDPSQDTLVFGADLGLTDHPNVSLSEDGRFLIVHVHKGWQDLSAFVADLARSDHEFVRLTPEGSQIYEVTAAGATLYVLTNEGAARFRLFAVDPDAPERAAWQLVIPEHATDVLGSVVCCGEQIFASYLHDAHARLARFTRAGAELEPVPLPGLGSSDGCSALLDGAELFFNFETFTTPAAVYRFTLHDEKLEPWALVPIPYDPDLYRVTPRAAVAADGTRIPYQIVHHRSADLSSRDNATLLYGYGGFNVSLTPRFSRSTLCFVERGGIFVQANLRGGGEFGADWHAAGQLAAKQNTFDDFSAVARSLIETGVTRPDRLAIHGRSNGGLLVAAALTQHPELFRAAVAGVPLTDMIRYEHFSIAKLWAPEYGTAADAAQFAVLHAYSPYHRVAFGTRYPAVLLTTAESDTRVDPLHARKFAAALAWATSSGQPVLLRTEPNAGHGAGIPVSKVIAETADIYAFLCAELGLPNASR